MMMMMIMIVSIIISQRMISVILLVLMVGSVIFPYAHPFGIPIWITQQVLSGVLIVLLDVGNVPLGIDRPKHSYFLPGHATRAIAVDMIVERESGGEVKEENEVSRITFLKGC